MGQPGGAAASVGGGTSLLSSLRLPTAGSTESTGSIEVAGKSTAKLSQGTEGEEVTQTQNKPIVFSSAAPGLSQMNAEEMATSGVEQAGTANAIREVQTKYETVEANLKGEIANSRTFRWAGEIRSQFNQILPTLGGPKSPSLTKSKNPNWTPPKWAAAYASRLAAYAFAHPDEAVRKQCLENLTSAETITQFASFHERGPIQTLHDRSVEFPDKKYSEESRFQCPQRHSDNACQTRLPA